MSGTWTVNHVCHSAYKVVSQPRLVVKYEDEANALIRCEAIDCEFFAWRAK